MPKIGILYGMENTFPSALVDRINSKQIPDVTAEHIRLGGVKMAEPSGYRVIIDRISQDIEFYRAFLKNAVLGGSIVINNPFWWTADDKFFNYALASQIGIAVPNTVILPHKEHPPGTTVQSMRNLMFPLNWEEVFDYIKFPAFLKPFSGGYVDNDPVVLARGRAYLDGLADVILIPGDLRDPGGILGHPELRRIIDFSQPAALSMTLLLHFVRDEEDPYGCVARLCDALCPGSCLVISHVTRENRDEAALGQIAGAYDRATAPMVMRTKDEVERFFAGFEMVEPGIVFLSQWRPSTEYYAGGGTRWVYAGVGRKP